MAKLHSDTVVGIIFWVVVVIGIGSFFHFRQDRDRAEIFLDVSTQPELVSGTVTFKGALVRDGLLHIAVFDARNQQYLAGTTLSVGKDGKFTSQGQPSLGLDKHNNPLSLTAKFRGALTETAKNAEEDAQVKLLSSESTLYINSPPPMDVWFLWSVIIATVLGLALQLILFTGRLGISKARWLFVLMYFCTFSSLALPIALSLVIAQNKYLVDAVEASPIGLIRAKTKGLSEPQWLINIGGTVVHEEKLAATSETPTPSLNPSEEAENIAETGGGLEPRRIPAAVESVNSSLIAPTVVGGVAVPFYVVLLAMFGAGINMTLKVPEIQRSYDDVPLEDENRGSSWLNPLITAWRSLRGEAETSPGVLTAGDIRRQLIENYMYLLSAPLLAIAMYYLLQVMAEQVTQPVLVLMAFATGLVSRAVVGGIIDFAETKLHREKSLQETSATHTRLVEIARISQREAAIAAQAAEEAKAKLTEVEVEARVAKEAAQKAKQKQADVEAARAVGDSEVTQAEVEAAQEEAKEAAQAAEAKLTEVEEAAKEAAKAAEARHAVAQTVATLAHKAEVAMIVQEAEAKQAAARTAAEATEEAAKEATEKQAEAEVAVKTAIKPVQQL